MTFLPIVERELRVRARRAGTHWSRWTVAVLAGLVAFQSFAVFASGGNLAMTVQPAFTSLVWMGFLLACAATLLTADCVSVEHREGTLGLLFLTDLKGYDVVLGKLAATGLNAFYALLGFAPALALPLLAGGVTGGEMFRATLAVLNVLFVALAAGLWVSTRAQTQFRAMRGSLLLVAGLMLGPWLLCLLFPPLSGGAISPGLFSPHYAFHCSSDALYKMFPAAFWWSLVIAHVEGWVMLVAAARAIEHNWREQARVETKRPVEEARYPNAAAGGIAYGRRYALGNCEPVCWRALQLHGQGAILWVAALIWSVGWIPMWLAYLLGGARLVGFGGFYQGVTTVTHFGAAALIAWAAGRFFIEARRTGELELLMSTPLGAHDIVSGQWVALWRRLRWPLAFVVFTVAVPSGIQALRRGLGPAPFALTAGLLDGVFTVANTVLSVLALCWVGMWFSVRTQKPIVAVAWAVGLVSGLPWLVTMLCYLGLAMGGKLLWRGSGLSPVFMVMFLALPLMNLATNLFLLRWAKGKLRAELRLAPLSPLSELLKKTPGVVITAVRRARHWTPS